MFVILGGVRGQYVVASPADRLAVEFGVEVDESADLEPSYNVASTNICRMSCSPVQSRTRVPRSP